MNSKNEIKSSKVFVEITKFKQNFHLKINLHRVLICKVIEKLHNYLSFRNDKPNILYKSE